MRGPGRPPGSPKTGGRKAGVKNRASVKREAEVKAGGITPLEYMLKVMRDEAQDPDVRLDAAKSAAPYVHPKLATVKLEGDPEKPLEHRIAVDAFTSRIARIAARNGESEGDSPA